MSGFLYYLPGPTQGVHLADVRRLGLGYAFDSDSFSAPGVMANGLDEVGQGVVVADPKRTENVGLYPDKQTWRSVPGGVQFLPGEVWVGCYKDDRPTPADLARKDQINGHYVTLNDGNEWLCPVARGATEEDGAIYWHHAVPQVSQLNEAGEFEPGDVVPKYAALWDTACRWFDVRMGAGDESDEGAISFSFDGLHKAAIEALATNYVIGPAECDLLGLLTQEAAIEILDVLIDMPTRFELQKKIANRLDTSHSEDGPSDDSLNTDQP